MAYTVFSPARSANAMTRAQGFLTQISSSVVAWNQARRTREALLKLSEHELEDIGLNRADIDTIAVKGRL